MLNLTVTGKVISTEMRDLKGQFCGRFMLRISQRIDGEFKHAAVECYVPVGMMQSMNWLTTTNTEYLVVCADRISRPSVWEFKGLDVIAGLAITRMERN